MSATADDTSDEFFQFQLAYGTPWFDRDRRLHRRSGGAGRIIKAIEAYTAIWRKGCTPPGSTAGTQ